MQVNNLFHVIFSGSTAAHEITLTKCKQHSKVAHKFYSCSLPSSHYE